MRPVNIIKIIHADKVGFDLHQIPYPTTIGVHVATETEPPYVLVRGYGDFRPASIVVTGDVTIMNGDGVVLSQESYERLTLGVRSATAAAEVCKTIRDHMGLDPRPVIWDELEQLRQKQEFPSSIQGSESRPAFNATQEDAHFDEGYSYKLFAELFGSSLPIVEMALAAHHRKHPRAHYKIYHRATPTDTGVIGYLEADKQMIFVICESEAKDLVGLSHSYLASYDLVESGGGRIVMQSGEGVTAFKTPRCGNGFTPLKTDLSPDDYAGPVTGTAIETRYTEPNSGIRFIPSAGYDAMDELIKRGHAHIFAQMFTWLAETQPNGNWYLYLNDLSRDGNEVVGIMEASGQPHLIVVKDKIRSVETLTSSEKECYGLKYIPDTGWKVRDYNGRLMFTIRLINAKIWDISVPTVY